MHVCKILLFKLHEGDEVIKITNSLDRYGQIVIQENSRKKLIETLHKCNVVINESVQIIEKN